MFTFKRQSREELEAYIQDAFAKYEQEHLHKEDIQALYSYREYLESLRKMAPGMNLERMNVPDLDPAKDNRMAAKIRLDGNRLYQNKNFDLALDRYYESICWAKNDSVDLGMGYANCSAVYYTTSEYENALLCISLAKKHDYPLQLMSKLLIRESKCKEMMKSGSVRISPISSAFVSNVAMNPRIPFLAEGISMKELPDYGRSMVADREFKAGDLILDEKAVLRSIKSGRTYSACHYCCSALIVLKSPCRNCVSAIYCSEECREADMQVVHRFECGISKQLDRIATGAHRIGLRMFFYGLNLFHDEVYEMMEFCKAHVRTGTDPFALDYVNRDPLEEFKVFHQTKVPHFSSCLVGQFMAHAAQYYWILVKHRPIQDIFTTYVLDDFMLQFMFVYMRAAQFLATYQVKAEITQCQLYSIAAVCNHSCIPNTCAVSIDGRLKFVVLRPIQEGEQILTSYNIIYPSADLDPIVREPKGCDCRNPDATGFKCKCLDCDPDKKRPRSEKYDAPLPISAEDLDEVRGSFRLDLDRQLIVMQAFMQQYGHLHSHPGFDEYIKSYRDILIRAFLTHSDNERRIRAGREAAGDEH